MKRKYGIVFGVVVIALLMVSSATAVTVTQSNVALEPGAVVESYESQVDPDINIGLDKLSTLYESLQYIDNPDVLSLVQAIIDEIEKDGSATSQDIQQIEEDLGIFFPIHAGAINSGGAGEALIALPGALILFVLTMYIGPSAVVYWSGLNHANTPAATSINLIERYRGNHQGFIIGFLGYCCFGPYGSWMLPVYGVLGVGALIIVIPGEGCASTVSLQSSLTQQTQPNSEPITITQNLVVSTTTSKQNTVN